MNHNFESSSPRGFSSRNQRIPLPQPTNYIFKSNISSQPQRPLSSDEDQAIKEVFDLFDLDRDGNLDLFQLRYALRALGFEVEKKEILALGTHYTKNCPEGAELISFENFKTIAEQKLSTRNPEEELESAFRLFDVEGKGVIDFHSLKRVAKDLGEGIDDEEIQAMITEFDLDDDNAINLLEFKRIMRSSK